jgi:hypothetical protein
MYEQRTGDHRPPVIDAVPLALASWGRSGRADTSRTADQPPHEWTAETVFKL